MQANRTRKKHRRKKRSKNKISQDLQEKLKKYFGYETFRPGQQEIVESILQGKNVLAVMPTGGGKSICYQLPGLLMPGLILVVSPLISLMKDQVEALQKLGIRAEHLDSSMSFYEQNIVLNLVLTGECKILYVSPERLQSQEFQQFAQKVHISLLAVDEAHCVSQWGRSFRKEYYEIPLFVAKLTQKPILTAFTATATPQVRQDILQHLGMRNAKVFVHGFDRPNLQFAVKRTGNKNLAVMEFLAKHKGQSGIIYCSTREQVRELHKTLQRGGVVSCRYHGGLTPLERQNNQNAFLENRSPVIVATNAFGMGIDKKDVRFVLHYNLPLTVEGYYQEAGRAGRDGGSADCVLLYNPMDIDICDYLIHEGETDSEIIKMEQELLKEMVRYTGAKDFRRFILEYFGEGEDN